MNRVLDVARIQLVNWVVVLCFPLALLVCLPVLGLVIDSANAEPGTTDHQIFLLPSLYLMVGLTHLQTMTQVFPFALGLSVTRRTFYAATALVVVAQAVLFGLLLLVFQRVERMTDGWGRHMRVYGLDYLVQENPIAQWSSYAAQFVAVSALGVFAGVVFHRWRQTGILVAIVGGVSLLAGAGALVTKQGWWPAIGRFFADQPDIAVVAGYPLALAAVIGGAGWLVIRRATP
ncbi:hypothetical protein ABZ816_37870 [Actinosynnema sp. NPDC047251]|uniref:Putative secreted protein n=1 Tax=Saccharothrix espanaensis (strain ATCC 51144 / DSM 44229 / JCM 9112 / NBRC 15066 / NRRL 15764) TaxID=1179773 RepID=K0JY20_SACES|nr:hypothetical protein [Saccharothrix espanaensis]CCH30232.1 putative secreted protein [Saccharothrix espanaensis DSM 44229]